MTYRSLLVLLDTDPGCSARVRTAIAMAQQLDSHLLGLAPTGLIEVPSVAGSPVSMADYGALAWDALRQQAQEVAGAFGRRCRGAGLKSFEAVVDTAGKAESVVHHAHCCDLALLTQADPAQASRRAAAQLVEQVVLASARPTLVLPATGPFESIGTRVLVAWNDSREASRAVWDALPLLRTAALVQVVHWTEGADVPSAQTMRTRLNALHRWLDRHGVKADMRVEAARQPVGHAMLAHAADFGADLLVMGAWGHSRWTERLLGGATRGLLETATLPVLMVH